MQAARGASLSSSDQTSPDSQTPARRRYLGLFATIAAVGYTVDVVSKVVAVEALAGEPPVEIVGHYFTLYLARNPGAAFSTGTSYTIVLSFIAIAAAIVVTWIARRLGSLGWAIGLGFLLAGVLGISSSAIVTKVFSCLRSMAPPPARRQMPGEIRNIRGWQLTGSRHRRV